MIQIAFGVIGWQRFVVAHNKEKWKIPCIKRQKTDFLLSPVYGRSQTEKSASIERERERDKEGKSYCADKVVRSKAKEGRGEERDEEGRNEGTK